MRPSILGGGLGFVAASIFVLGTAHAGPKVDVCHVTGNGSVLTLNVSTNALGGHLGHGDSTPSAVFSDADGDGFGDSGSSVLSCTTPPGTTSVGGDCDDSNAAVSPGEAEVCGDGIDNNCDGVADEGCAGGCGPAVGDFFDDFEGPDGELGAPWETGVAGTLDPFISNGQACGTEQSVAIFGCLADSSTTDISFDFVANSIEAQEAWAVFAESTDPLSGAFVVGCDGGYNSATGPGPACGFTIGNVLGGPDLAGPALVDLVIGDTYSIAASAVTNGPVTVFSGTLFDSNGNILETLSGVTGAITVNSVGFVTGRDPNSTTCVDNFDFSSSP